MFPFQQSLAKHRRAFALVAVLLLLSVGLAILMAWLGLTMAGGRGANALNDRDRARAHAKFGLEEALYALQTSLGPDQRISGGAGVFDTDEETPVMEGVTHGQWKGVWHSWKTWQTGEDVVGEAVATSVKEKLPDTYEKGRPTRFLRWLVSDPEKRQEDVAFYKTVLPEADRVEIVGKGTLGDVATGFVQVPLVDLPKDAEGDLPSRYGWWIDDEGAKARINLLSPDDSETLDLAEAVFEGGTYAGAAIPVETLPALPEDFDSRKLLDLSMLAQALGEEHEDKVKALYHDYTTWSEGVLADVRQGGLKKDLSLLLEMDTLPTAYAGISNIGVPKPIRAYESIPRGLYTWNFPSWYSLQQYYQLHRIDSMWNPPDAPTNANRLEYSANSSLADVDGGVFWKSGKPMIDYYLRDGVNSFGSYRHWVCPKVELVMSIQRVDAGTTSTYRLNYNPAITLWNPYNVTLRIPPIHLILNQLPVLLRVYKNGTLVTDWTYPPNLAFNIWFRNTYRPVGNADTSWIILEPGETRLFSAPPIRAESGPHIEVYPGYSPNAGGWDGILLTAPATDKVEISMKLDSTRRNGDMDSLWINTMPHPGEYSAGANPWQLSYLALGQDVAVIPDTAGDRMSFPNQGDNRRRPAAIVRAILKTGQRLDGGGDNYPDYRNRFAIHANPANHRPALNGPTDKFLAAAQYEFTGLRLAGELDRNLPQVAPDNRHSYIGSGNDAAEGQPNWLHQEIPIAPLTSLAQLQHFRLEPGARIWNARVMGPADNRPASHLWDISANQALGIGNSFAYPLIKGDAVFQLHSDNRRNIAGRLQYDRLADTWDHAFLANEALFDSWYFSGTAPQSTGLFVEKRPITKVLTDFISGEKKLPQSTFRLWKDEVLEASGVNVGMENRLLANGKILPDAFGKSTAHLMNLGQFNVNSTSKEAWKALFNGLRHRAIAVMPAGFAPSLRDRRTEGAVVSRFSLISTADDGAGPYDSQSWNGVRLLTDEQIDRLAEEMVEQVKLRGPFLNLAEFVNRRLATDRTGVLGALQAALDWDDDGAGGDVEAINGIFKGGDNTITASDLSGFTYEFPEAGAGSRWAGVPGYVTQADLLTRLAPVIAVRSDTFVIRSYGEYRHPKSGVILSRAWCEAVVQRFPEFYDPTQAPDTPQHLLNETNKTMGRRFRVVSFRWLLPEDV